MRAAPARCDRPVPGCRMVVRGATADSLGRSGPHWSVRCALSRRMSVDGCETAHIEPGGGPQPSEPLGSPSSPARPILSTLFGLFGCCRSGVGLAPRARHDTSRTRQPDVESYVPRSPRAARRAPYRTRPLRNSAARRSIPPCAADRSPRRPRRAPSAPRSARRALHVRRAQPVPGHRLVRRRVGQRRMVERSSYASRLAAVISTRVVR
jgi:hypothetical protein